jgi:hypothetical protein
MVDVPLLSPRNIYQQVVAHLYPDGNEIPGPADIKMLNQRNAITVPTNQGIKKL